MHNWPDESSFGEIDAKKRDFVLNSGEDDQPQTVDVKASNCL